MKKQKSTGISTIISTALSTRPCFPSKINYLFLPRMQKIFCIAFYIHLAYSRYYYYFLSYYKKLAFSILFIVFHKSSIRNKFRANISWRHHFHLLHFIIPFSFRGINTIYGIIVVLKDR